MLKSNDQAKIRFLKSIRETISNLMDELYLVSRDIVASMVDHPQFEAAISQGDLLSVSNIARTCMLGSGQFNVGCDMLDTFELDIVDDDVELYHRRFDALWSDIESRRMSPSDLFDALITSKLVLELKGLSARASWDDMTYAATCGIVGYICSSPQMTITSPTDLIDHIRRVVEGPGASLRSAKTAPPSSDLAGRSCAAAPLSAATCAKPALYASVGPTAAPCDGPSVSRGAAVLSNPPPDRQPCPDQPGDADRDRTLHLDNWYAFWTGFLARHGPIVSDAFYSGTIPDVSPPALVVPVMEEGDPSLQKMFPPDYLHVELRGLPMVAYGPDFDLLSPDESFPGSEETRRVVRSAWREACLKLGEERRSWRDKIDAAISDLYISFSPEVIQNVRELGRVHD